MKCKMMYNIIFLYFESSHSVVWLVHDVIRSTGLTSVAAYRKPESLLVNMGMSLSQFSIQTTGVHMFGKAFKN